MASKTTVIRQNIDKASEVLGKALRCGDIPYLVYLNAVCALSLGATYSYDDKSRCKVTYHSTIQVNENYHQLELSAYSQSYLLVYDGYQVSVSYHRYKVGLMLILEFREV